MNHFFGPKMPQKWANRSTLETKISEQNQHFKFRSFQKFVVERQKGGHRSTVFDALFSGTKVPQKGQYRSRPRLKNYFTEQHLKTESFQFYALERSGAPLQNDLWGSFQIPFLKRNDFVERSGLFWPRIVLATICMRKLPDASACEKNGGCP